MNLTMVVKFAIIKIYFRCGVGVTMEAKKTKTMLDANQIFILCAEEDKDYVIALQKNFVARKLKVWSMFRDDGNYSVGLGDDHLQVAISELKKTCVVVMLISENSIRKGADKNSFIFQEINNFYNLSASCKNYHMKLIPICIGEDYFNQLPESWMPFGLNSFKISSTLKTKRTMNGEEIDNIKLNHICNEVSNIYFECMNSNYKYILENKYNLVVLGNKLMSSTDTIVKTISDDIRQTDENDSDSLSAIHLITNEISEYDCNAYSLMIISANLLGVPDGKFYNPRKNGIKYYYYCPQKYLESIEEDYRNRIISFLKRDEDAITYVENSIRAHYVVSKNLIAYLLSVFSHKSITSILLSFSIPETEKGQFITVVDPYDGDFYDSDSESIALPNSFFEWLFGRDIKFNIEVFEFIHTVTEFLKHTEIHNISMINELIGVEKMLDRIYNFHTYMHSKNDKITHNKFRSIAKKVIGLTNDQNNTLIERWVIDRENSDEWDVQDMNEIISKALENMKFIPIKDSDDFIPCNSFAVYDHKDKLTGKRRKKLVWYSTAHNFVQTAEKVSANDEQEMLVILNEKTTSQDCDVVRNTLKYLKSVNLIDKYYEF